MGLCFSKDAEERDNSYVTPEMVSPQYYYSGIIRLSSFRSGPGTPPGVTRLLESPRMSSMALDSPRQSVSVCSRDFIVSPRISADVGDTGTLNALFNRSRMGGRQGIGVKYHHRSGGGSPGGNEGGELQVARTVYSTELSSSQRLATQKILQCHDRESRKHCICCTDCGSKKIAKCRDCGSDKLAICPMCDNRIPRCGECRFGKPLSCGACGSARLSSSLQIEAGKINCGGCGAIMLASCDRCATRFKRPTCGHCGRPSTDAESRDELEEFSEFGLDQSAEADSSVEFLELSTGVVELRKKPPRKRFPQRQQGATTPSRGPVEGAQQQQAEGANSNGYAGLLAKSSTEEDLGDSKVAEDTSFDCDSACDSGEEPVIEDGEGPQDGLAGKESTDSEAASHAAVHTRNISFGKYVPEVPHAAAEAGSSSGRHPPHLMQALYGDVSFSSFLAGPALAALTNENDGLDGLSLLEFGQPFESVAKSYAEAAALAAARDAFVFREENDASLTFPKLFEAAPSSEHVEQWSVPFLSLETDSVPGSADLSGKEAPAGGRTHQAPKSSLPDSTLRASAGVSGTMTKAQERSVGEDDGRNDSKVKGKSVEAEEPFMPTGLQEGAESSNREAGLGASPEDDRRSKIMDRMEERFIRAQLHTHGFLLDSLSKEEFTDQLKLRHAALRRKASESGAGFGAMAGIEENIVRNLQRKSAEYVRSTNKEQEITEVEEEEEVEVELVRTEDLRKKKRKEKGGVFSSVSEGLFPKKQGGSSKGPFSEQVPDGLEERVMFIERAFNRRKEGSQDWDEGVKVRATDNHINMSEFIQALKDSSKLPSQRQGVYSLTKGLEPQGVSPVRDGSRKGKAVSWGYVVREPRSKSFEETRTRHPIFDGPGGVLPRRRHSLESDRNAAVRDSDLKSCLKTKSSVPPAPSSMTDVLPEMKKRYPPSSRPGRVPLTFSADPFMPQAELSNGVQEKKLKSKSSESFKYESLAAFSMVPAYDSDVSAQTEKRSVSSRSRGSSLTNDSVPHVNRSETTRGDQVFGGSSIGGMSRRAGLVFLGGEPSAVRDVKDDVSVQDLCDVLSLSSIERSSPNHRSSRSHGSESRMAGSLRRSSSVGKMSAMGMESSSSSFMSLRNFGAMEEEIEHFLGASPRHNKSTRKAEIQRKVNQIAGLAHLPKQHRPEEGKPSDWISGGEPWENTPLDVIAKREETAMAFITQSRKAAMAEATSYTNVGSPASSMDEEVEKFVVGGSNGRLDDSGACPGRDHPGTISLNGEQVVLEEGPSSNKRKAQTIDGLPHWLGATEYGTAFGSPLDAIAPQRSEYAQAYKPATSDVFGGEHSRRRTSTEKAAAHDLRRGFLGTLAYGLPAFLPSDFEPMGAGNGARPLSGRYTVSIINAASSFEADMDFSGGDGAWDTKGDSDSSSDLFEIETDSSVRSRKKPGTPPPCEVIDVALFEEFAESLAASPMSVTLSLSSLDAYHGSDLNLSVNFSEDDMEDMLVYPRVSASGAFTPIFSEEETTELDSDYNSRWSSSIRSSSVSGSVDIRGLGALARYGNHPNGGISLMPLPLPLPPKANGRVPGAAPTSATEAAPAMGSDAQDKGELKKSAAEGKRFHDEALRRLGIRRSSPRFDMDAETSMVSSSDIDLHRQPSSGSGHRSVHNLSDLSALSLGARGGGAGGTDSDADMSSIEISPAVLAQAGSVYEAFGQMYLLRPRRHVTNERLSSRPRRYPSGGRR